MNYKNLDEVYMGLAIEEAKKGLGHVNPNPLVGAVLVKNDQVIGIGHHQKYGSAHAEVNAISNAIENGHDVFDSILYVNLEPCSHTNKQTPPCAPAIVKHKIKKVIIANIDPNPNVCGKGIAHLKENGIEVEVGILKEEGEKLNEVFFHAMNTKRPFIHLKMGQTLDGKVATRNGESKYITGPEAREYVHELRQKYDVILIGKKTLIQDNPSLTTRLKDVNEKHPLRVVLIDLKSIDFSLNVFSDEYKRNTMVVTTDFDLQTNPFIVEKLEEKGIGILALEESDSRRVNLKSLISTLYSLKLNSILLEGGPTLASSFLKSNLVDKISIITAPVLLGEGLSTLSDIGINELKNKLELNQLTYKQLGNDFLAEGYLCSQV